jgi:hypothetical protein
MDNKPDLWILVTDVRGNWLRFGTDTYCGRKLARERRDYFRELFPWAEFKVKKLYSGQTKED